MDDIKVFFSYSHEDEALRAELAKHLSLVSSPIITQVLQEMDDLSDDLKQQVLKFVVALRQQHLQTSSDAWDVLESLTGTVEAPADWSSEHDHYLQGTPRPQKANS